MDQFWHLFCNIFRYLYFLLFNKTKPWYFSVFFCKKNVLKFQCNDLVSRLTMIIRDQNLADFSNHFVMYYYMRAQEYYLFQLLHVPSARTNLADFSNLKNIFVSCLKKLNTVLKMINNLLIYRFLSATIFRLG